MPELPYEIWEHIASLLPPDVLSRVQFSLNRAFLECGLQEKYQAVHFGEFANQQAFRTFTRLRDPTLAARVRHLTFHNDAFPVCMKSSVPKSPQPVLKESRWKQLVSRDGGSPHPKPPPLISESDFLEIISNMINLTSFTVEALQHPAVDPRHHCSKLLDSALHSFSATLQTLRITISVYLTSWTLPTTTLLPNLLHFEVNLRDRCILSQASAGVFGDTLISFLIAHRTTIESMEVGLYRCTFLHLSTILGPLEPFPHLTALSLVQNSPSDSSKIEAEEKEIADAIHRFVLHSAPRLVQLGVDSWPGVLTALARQPFDGSNHVKPRIQALKIYVQPGVPQNVLSPPFFTDFLRPIIPTLVDLELTPLALEGLEFKALLGVFPRSVQNPPLRRLAVEVVVLDREVFSYASVMLPELKTLEIGYCYLGSPTPPAPIGSGLVVSTLRIPTIEFCRYLHDSQHFDAWDLEHLRLKPLKMWPWASCKKAIAEAFPRVKTFNGASREEYLASSNMNTI